jgi:hypothetical protein
MEGVTCLRCYTAVALHDLVYFPEPNYPTRWLGEAARLLLAYDRIHLKDSPWGRAWLCWDCAHAYGADAVVDAALWLKRYRAEERDLLSRKQALEMLEQWIGPTDPPPPDAVLATRHEYDWHPRPEPQP